MKGHIETMVRENDRQPIHITGIVAVLSANSQASADAANAFLDCDISQGVMGHELRAARPSASLRAPVGSNSRVTPLPPVVTTIRRTRAIRVARGLAPQVRGPYTRPARGGSTSK